MKLNYYANMQEPDMRQWNAVKSQSAAICTFEVSESFEKAKF